MLLDELKIEQDDLKVGDVVYTSHHPNIGVWVSFRYSKMRKEVIQRITPKRTKIVTDDEDMLNVKNHMNAVRKILDSYEQE